MKETSGYTAVESRFPLRGLSSNVPSTQNDPSFSPRMNNITIREGVGFKRSGYWELGSNTTMVGDVLGVVDFQLLDDTRILVALTSRRQYKYNNGNDEWDDITAQQSVHEIIDADDTVDTVTISDDQTAKFLIGTEFVISGSTDNDGTYIVTGIGLTGSDTLITIAAVSLSSSTVDGIITGVGYVPVTIAVGLTTIDIDGDQTTNFKEDDVIEIIGSTSNDGFYTLTIDSTLTGGDTTLTLTPSLVDTTADGRVYKLQTLTTISGDNIDFVTGTDLLTHRLYSTNGRDRVRFWDGSSTKMFVWHPEFTGFTTCKTMSVFFDLLVLGNVTLAANSPKLIAWSDTADFDEFNLNNSGTLLIPSLVGLIQTSEPLGDRLAIYSNDTTALLTFVGSTAIIAAEVVLRNTRLVSAQGVASLGSAHLFASQENLYFFDGTRSIRAVGDTIRELYKQALNLEFSTRLFIFNDVVKRMMFIVVPVSSTESTTFVLDYNIFNLNEFKWTQLEYTDLALSLGFYARIDSPDWLDPPLDTWAELFGIWFDEGERINFPVRIMGAGVEVFQLDEGTETDDGTAVTASYETRDFVVPGIDQSVVGRWGEIEIDARGQSVQVYYSTDQGGLWTLAGTQTLENGFAEYRFPIDTTSRTLRVKLESTVFFAFRWIRAWVKSNAPR